MTAAAPAPLGPETFERFRRLIHEKTGIWMREGKHILVSNRLRRRLAALGLASYDDYLALLESPGADRAEMSRFIDAVSTNETYFYREAAHFAVLAATVLPGLLGRGRPVRLWCAGCSTGEEVYTLRITCDGAVARHGGAVEIVGTDISTTVVAAAKAGIYRERSVRLVPPEALRANFEAAGEGAWRVRRDLADRVAFHVHNLLADPPPPGSPFDVIFCRNVMIYFDKPTQKRLVDSVFAPALRDDGWLFVGHAESLTGTSERFAYRPVSVDGSARGRAPVYRPVAAAAAAARGGAA